jgi:tRNA(Ile)-lysidine synthase
MDNIVGKVGGTIEKYGLIEKGDRVLVGFSGGTDSVAMLHILHQLQKKLEFSMAAVYINHNIRPRAAKKEARFCEDFCREYSIPFSCEEIDIPKLTKDEKAGIEETARIHRYRTLERLAAEQDFSRIAVGHHRDDRAETILFNLLRGSGRMGLAGIPPRRGKVIRPLYDLRRLEIADYLEDNSLKFMIDRSNRSRKFVRNRIRHRIIPLMQKEITGAAVDNIVRYSEILADEEKYLSEMTSDLIKKLVTTTPGGKIRLDLNKKFQYDEWLKRRLVFGILANAGFIDIEFAEVDKIVKLIDDGRQTRLSLREGYLAEVAGDSMYLYRPGPAIDKYEVTVPGRCRLDHPQVWIDFEYVDNKEVKEISTSDSRIAFIDAEELQGTLYLSRLMRGARFHPYGRPGSKKAGDFLTDRKYPRPLRDELPVLYDQKGIVWLAGLEIDHRVQIHDETRKIIKIEIGKD